MGFQEGRGRVGLLMTLMVHILDTLLLRGIKWRWWLDQRLLFGCQLLN